MSAITLSRRAAVALLAASSIALMSGGAMAQNAAPDLSGVSLTIGVQSSGSSVVKALIDASGLFADTPYKLTWADFSGADGAVEALNAGAVDADIGLNFAAPVLGQANASHAWTADDRPYVIIGANKSLDDAGTAIVVHPNSGINAVTDLKGKSVSFAKGTANHYFLALAAKKAGLDLATVTPVLMPLTEARAAFVGGSVDALVTGVSNARPLISSGDGLVLTTSKGLYDSYAWFVVRPEVLKDPAREAAIGDLLVRLQKQDIWEATHHDEVAATFVKVGHQKPEDASLNADSHSAFVPIDDKVITANQNQVNVFAEAGVAKSKVDAAIGFDTRFNDLIAANPGPSPEL